MTVDCDDSVASVYASSRGASANVIDELRAFAQLSAGPRVLEVGCGTASHVIALVIAAGCHGWGLEPSDSMRRRVPFCERLGLVPGSAESLPFGSGCFDLVFSVNVIHHVADPYALFREARRTLTPAGMVCTVTDTTEMIRNRKPLSQYWPSSVEADLKRYPRVESLLDQTRQAGLADHVTREIRTPFAVTDSTPYRDRAFSCIHMISDGEFEDGLARLEADLQEGPVEGLEEYVCIWGRVA